MARINKRYNYSCTICGGAVIKKPVAMLKTPKAPGRASNNGNNKIESVPYTGLHGWRCAVDGPGVKVRRELAKDSD